MGVRLKILQLLGEAWRKGESVSRSSAKEI